MKLNLDNRSARIAVVVLTLAAAMIYLLGVSWMRWGHLIVDTWREAWVPYKILQGKILYKDIVYPYGFIAPYTLALFYKLFGLKITSLVICSSLLTFTASLLIHKITRFFLGYFEALLAALTFLFVFAFGNYNQSSGIFNFILPYSFATVFTVFFILAAFYCFLSFVSDQKLYYLWLWVFFISLAFFSRIIMTFPVWLAFVAVIFVCYWKKIFFTLYKAVFFSLLPLVIAFTGYFLFLFITGAFDGFSESVISFAALFTRKDFTFSAATFGVTGLKANLFFIFNSLLFNVLAVFISLAGAFSCDYFYNKKQRVMAILMLFISLSILLPLAYFTVHDQYCGMQVLLFVATGWIFLYLLRGGADKKKIMLFALCLVSMAMIVRFFLKLTPHGIGFAFLALVLVAYYVLIFTLLEKMHFIFFKKCSARLSVVFLRFFLVGVMIFVWLRSSPAYSQRVVKIPSAMGYTYCYPDVITEHFLRVYGYLLADGAKDKSLVVLPSGVALNLFTGMDSPLRYVDMGKFEFTAFKEEKILGALSAAIPDYLVIFTFRPLVNMPDGTIFGYNYAHKTLAWIRNNYHCVGNYVSQIDGPLWPLTLVFKRNHH